MSSERQPRSGPQGRYLGDFAQQMAAKPAAIDATTGRHITYGELEDRSNRLAQYLHRLGLKPGDRIAALLENHLAYFEIAWAAFRSGLLLTAVNRYLTPDEAAYVIGDCDARVVISSFKMRDLATALTQRMPQCERRLMMDGCADGWEPYEDALASAPAVRLQDEWMGGTMLYSSGTTGRPKGIVRSLFGTRISDGPEPGRAALIQSFGFDSDSVYLSPAPMYHAAALGYATTLQFCGGTTVVMEKFDAEQSLALIEKYRITHSQWVPTMFVRMLKLPRDVRERYDLSSQQKAIHAAAPCPVEVKRQMIDWWGPIVHEYYTGTEGNGMTTIDSAQALARPGSVGRAVMGTLHICAEDGVELPAGQDGLIYFERDRVPFRYHKDEAKTRSAQHPLHDTWTTLGDIGRMDADGYLYLTDRKDFMIISGGVNIYPQAIEDALTLHPDVADVAVIGVPDAEMGESVKAIVELAEGVEPGVAQADKLIGYLQGKVARYMVPRSVDFIDEMPRLATGKLAKRVLRDRYLKAASAA